MSHSTSKKVTPDSIIALIEARAAERFPDPGDHTADRKAIIAISMLEVAYEYRQSFVPLMQGLVDEARDGGATWAEIAAATGLAGASSALYMWGHDDDDVKKAEMRQRMAKTRAAIQKEKHPGLSAIQAGVHYGVDRRTVKSRGEKGEIPTVIVQSANGKDQVRYLVS